MGQKVHPTAFRLGFNQPWRSRWFRRDLKGAVVEDFFIRELLKKDYPRGAIKEVVIERKEDQVRVIIHTARPGILIGRAGQGTRDISQKLIKEVLKSAAQKLEIEIREVKQPELSAELAAQGIASQIERRIAAKRAMRQAMTKAMEKGAKGIKIQVSGRLGGSEIARSDRVSSGTIPLSTLRSDIDFSTVHAKTTWGTIGVKVWIYLGDKVGMEDE